MTTNPNDILDAYDELVRLVTILGPDTIRNLLDRACGRCAETGVKTTNVISISTIQVPAEQLEPSSPPAHPASETTCPWCGIQTTKNTMFRHLNNTHRTDLEQLYVDDGIKGIQDTFGVSYQTAWNWARKLDGEAA